MTRLKPGTVVYFHGPADYTYTATVVANAGPGKAWVDGEEVGSRAIVFRDGKWWDALGAFYHFPVAIADAEVKP